MQKLYALCGLVGSGKTTFAKQLAKSTGAFRFTMDEWMIPLFGEHMPRAEFNKRQIQLTELFKQSAEQLLESGVPVIFDFGFWEKQQRTAIGNWADDIGAEFELVYLECSPQTCRDRVMQRNDETALCYEMTDDMLQLFNSRFTAPDIDEQATLINTEKQ